MSTNNSSERCYIWAISFFLFLSILAGGIFLGLYMIQPESPTSSWYPIVGITLVCLPWFFWLLTCFYRILSRTFGFRMVCWGTNVYPVESVHEEGVSVVDGSGNDSNLENQHMSAMNNDQSHTRNSRQVHFGETVVVAEEDNNKSSHDAQSSTPSKDSNETEIPFKMSMGS